MEETSITEVSSEPLEPGFDAIFYIAPVVMALVDDDGRLARINHAGATFAGRGEEELLGRLGGEVFRCINAFRKGGCGETPYCGRCVVRTAVTSTFRDGRNIYKREGSLDVEGAEGIETRHFCLSTNLFEMADRKRVLLTLDDITAQKRAEVAAAASEGEYRALIAGMSSALAVYEAVLGGEEFPVDFRCLSANPAFRALAGAERGDLVGRSVSEIFPGATGEWIGLMDHVATSGQPFQTEIADADQGVAWEVRAFSPANGVVATLVNDITGRKRMEAELQRLAATDALTGVNSRRQFLDLTEREMSRTIRYGGDTALLMMDVDDFKAVNDTYGHAGGDEVLKSMAEACRGELREGDIFGRLGGEEFGVTLAESDAFAAAVVAERLRARIEQTPVSLNGAEVRIAVSIGVSVLAGKEDTVDALLLRADRALYRAKRNGRNRVEFDVYPINQLSAHRGVDP